MRYKEKFICSNCQTVIEREPRKINPNQKLYFCNRQCWREYRKMSPVISDKFLEKAKEYNIKKQQEGYENREKRKKVYICDTCHKKFRRHTSWGERVGGTFCSKKCAGQARNVIGKFKTRIFRSRQSVKNAIKIRYIDECAICHWSEAPCDAHHIEPIKSGGKNILSNLVILCPNHHREADFGLINRETLEVARQSMKRVPGLPDRAYIDYDEKLLP